MNTRLNSGSTAGKDSLGVLESRYSHIEEGLLRVWQDPEATDLYLNSVLVDDRDNRKGLPAEAFEELMFLSDLNWKRTHFNADGVQVSPDNFSFGIH